MDPYTFRSYFLAALGVIVGVVALAYLGWLIVTRIRDTRAITALERDLSNLRARIRENQSMVKR
jgi:Tfp pilus assembly protein PilN